MHTIEAAVLVPLGLGLLSIILMLTFCLHDQVVLAAECAELMLEWQHGGESSKGKKEIEEELRKGKLITEVTCSEFSGGKVLCRLQIKENWRVFQRGLAMLSLDRMEEDEARTKSFALVKINPCWLKRIWRVSGLG